MGTFLSFENSASGPASLASTLVRGAGVVTAGCTPDATSRQSKDGVRTPTDTRCLSWMFEHLALALCNPCLCPQARLSSLLGGEAPDTRGAASRAVQGVIATLKAPRKPEPSSNSSSSHAVSTWVNRVASIDKQVQQQQAAIQRMAATGTATRYEARSPLCPAQAHGRGCHTHPCGGYCILDTLETCQWECWRACRLACTCVCMVHRGASRYMPWHPSKHSLRAPCKALSSAPHHVTPRQT